MTERFDTETAIRGRSLAEIAHYEARARALRAEAARELMRAAGAALSRQVARLHLPLRRGLAAGAK